MSHNANQAASRPETLVLTAPPSPDEIDRNPFMDYLTRKVMKGWMEHEPRPQEIPWTPLRKPLSECRLALASSSAAALAGDRPFDQEGERRNPWWGDPSYRMIPRGTRTGDVRFYHLHVDSSFGERDLNCVLPLDRAEELAASGEIGSVAPTHYSFMGYLLRPEEFLRTSVAAMIERMRAESVDLALLVPV
jgi:D-proline reductase (dithiol) PrdB